MLQYFFLFGVDKQRRLLSDWSIHTLVPRFIAPRAAENLINKHGCRKEGFYFLCLITCSIVLFKNNKCSASVCLQNDGKRSGRRCFEGGKTFFSSIVGLAEEKNEHFVPKKSNYVS